MGAIVTPYSAILKQWASQDVENRVQCRYNLLLIKGSLDSLVCAVVELAKIVFGSGSPLSTGYDCEVNLHWINAKAYWYSSGLCIQALRLCIQALFSKKYPTLIHLRLMQIPPQKEMIECQPNQTSLNQ